MSQIAIDFRAIPNDEDPTGAMFTTFRMNAAHLGARRLTNSMRKLLAPDLPVL